MKTRMTELFGIKHPIMLAGMNWATTPKLVAAVSNAGGLGILGGAAYTPETRRGARIEQRESLREAIKEVRSLTDKPFGINVMLWSPETMAAVPTLLEEKVPVVNYSLGRPAEIAPLIQAVHEYGGKVVGTVALLRHALRSEQLGADMLSVTGYEAASHSGNVGALVLIPQVAEQVKIPIIGVGGYADGRGLAAALALGAEGIAMGTRLAVTQESETHEYAKQLWVKGTEEDTVIDPAFDGINCRVIKSEVADEIMKKRLPVVGAVTGALRMKRMLNMSFGELIRAAWSLRQQEERGIQSLIRFAAGTDLLEAIVVNGNPRGLLHSGQTMGRIHDIPTVAEVIERTVAEAEEILESMKAKIGS